jgi:tagaturonate reductase
VTQTGLTILPCELVSGNGAVLRGIVGELATRWYEDPAFDAWLEKSVIFCNTLVDRIVSESLSPAGAVAEPYALWAIQRVDGQALPCRHPAIVIADDIGPFERLKLFILNLGHTLLADRWLEQKMAEDLTVREILTDGSALKYLQSIYNDEVIPGFAAMGMADAARDYIATTLERFSNPFLDHRLADIAQNHAEKINRRLGGFIAWSHAEAPTLQAILDKPR